MGKKCIVLFSNGLDSRLAVKIMQEQGFEVIAIYFKFPFGAGCISPDKEVKKFCKENKVELKVFNCTKGNYLKRYLKVIKEPVFGWGKSLNPCIDCRLFIFKYVKKYADKNKINLIVSGEVLNERPMSQHSKALRIVEAESGLSGRLLRPLSAKLLEETNAEKRGLVNREDLFKIQGRQRKEQIQLAKKFQIDFPSPAGGCLLCEKDLKKRFEFLVSRGISEEEIKLIRIGRHFLINNQWIILGKDEVENKLLSEFKGKLIVPIDLGPSALVVGTNKVINDLEKKVQKLIKIFSKKGSLGEREKFRKEFGI